MPAVASRQPRGALAFGVSASSTRALGMACLIGPMPFMPPNMHHASRPWFASPLSSSGCPAAAEQCLTRQQFSEVVAINGCHSTSITGTEAGYRYLSCANLGPSSLVDDDGFYSCVGTYGADDVVGCYSTQHHIYLCDDGSKFSTCGAFWGAICAVR